MVISTLNTFFTKVYICATLMAKPDAEIASALGVSPYFVKDYKLAAKNYPIHKIEFILHTLNTLDLRSKGIMTNTGDEDLYKEMLYSVV